MCVEETVKGPAVRAQASVPKGLSGVWRTHRWTRKPLPGPQPGELLRKPPQPKGHQGPSNDLQELMAGRLTPREHDT